MELTRLRRAVAITVVEIKPHRWYWKVFEVLGVEPVLPEKPLLVPYNSMWRRFAEFKSVADSVQTRSESFNLLLLEAQETDNTRITRIVTNHTTPESFYFV
jgi:hypothetical protein